MKRMIPTVCAAVAVMALLAAGLFMPQAVEAAMAQRADAVQTVRAKEVTPGGLLTPLELFGIMNGGYEGPSEINASEFLTEGTVSVYEVSVGNRYTADTARAQAQSEVLDLLKVSGLTDTMAYVDQADRDSSAHAPDYQKRRQELAAGKYDAYENDYVGGAVCSYVVAPTYPSPKTAMVWMCNLYYASLGEEIVAVLDDATGCLLGVQLRVVDSVQEGDLKAVADRFMEAFAARLDLKAHDVTAETEIDREAPGNWTTDDGGYWVFAYRLEDGEGSSAACTLSWIIDGADATILQINM